MLGGAKGGYVYVLTLANSDDDYKSKVSEVCEDLEFDVVDISDAESFEERARKYTLAPKLGNLAKQVIETRGTGFGTFHTFKDE